MVAYVFIVKDLRICLPNGLFISDLKARQEKGMSRMLVDMSRMSFRQRRMKNKDGFCATSITILPEKCPTSQQLLCSYSESPGRSNTRSIRTRDPVGVLATTCPDHEKRD